MSRIAYPTSDAELETWVEQTIQREIARGRMLQDQKSLSSERTNNVAVFMKPPKLANGLNSDKRTISQWNKRRSRSPLTKNHRMSSSLSRDDSCCSSYKSPRLTRPACSMRISELAVPSKRQCMASWRANANVLPETMINRLKQRVLDQEPVVKVSDTVHCWKRNRRSSDTSNSVIITPTQRPSRKINKEAMKNKIQAEYKVLSDAFGVKIAELLMKPIAISLNSELKKIANVISEEIYNIIKDTKTFKIELTKAFNNRMLEETSEKVTIWIAKILEDSSEKLLEEDLKARATNPAGDMLTLIEIITCQERDIEEQEGPVLDILDDLVDTILHQCIKKTPSEIFTPEYVSVTSEDSEKGNQEETSREEVTEKASKGDVIVTEKASQGDVRDEDNIEKDIIKQIDNVIDSIAQENSLERPSKVFNESDLNRETREDLDKVPEVYLDPEPEMKSESGMILEPDASLEPEMKSDPGVIPEPDASPEPEMKLEPDMKPEPDIDVLYSNDTPLAEPKDDNENTIKNINGTSESSDFSSTKLPLLDDITEPSVFQNENNEDEKRDNTTLLAPEENNVIDTNEEQTSNVSGAIEIINEDLSEGKNKTVQFSKENLGLLNNKEQSNPFYREKLQLEDKPLLENIGYFEKPKIDFAPPNEELLSDADESWPETRPTTKPSASVTRSITSMGKLLESDEILSDAFEDGTEYLLQTTDSNKHHENDGDEINKQSTLNPQVTENSEENYSYHREIGDLQKSSSDAVKSVNEISDLTQKALNQSEIETEMSLLQLIREAPVTSLPRQASDIQIESEKLKEKSLTYDGHAGESDFLKRGLLKSPGCLDEVTSRGSKAFIPQKFDYQTNPQRRLRQVGTNIDQQQASSFYTNSTNCVTKRVHLKTAPDWITRGQGEPNGSPCVCRPFKVSGLDKMKERERDMQKWYHDLNFILMNLDKWKNWLDYISKYITDLKRKAGKINRSRQMRLRSPPGTDDEVTWRQLNRRANGGLEMRRKHETVKLKIPSAPLKYCLKCGRRKPNQSKKRHHQNHSRNNAESKCKRHCRREYEACLRKN